jgi:hypothetical protein
MTFSEWETRGTFISTVVPEFVKEKLLLQRLDKLDDVPKRPITDFSLGLSQS